MIDLDNLDQPLQMNLLPIEKPSMPLGMTLEERFWQFHLANPHVAEAIRVLARMLKSRGKRRGSINAIYERLRWEWDLQTADPNSRSQFRLNNSYRAFYSRLLMQEEEFANFFETRSQRAVEAA